MDEERSDLIKKDEVVGDGGLYFFYVFDVT